ncbi:hypothetical protein HNQ58_001214 [Rehaibacterium terrae]|jgi:hypothetical protein|uniref:Uncharacterized protein n=1 Tax=Rehaibacterium terrae TaxID=1341696 RepID=A0A7W7XZT7_9GAMM|nr:hypothetical protein [Rehaibacterium terrae]
MAGVRALACRIARAGPARCSTPCWRVSKPVSARARPRCRCTSPGARPFIVASRGRHGSGMGPGFAFPLPGDDRPIGLLHIACDTSEGIKDALEDALATVADLLGLAIRAHAGEWNGNPVPPRRSDAADDEPLVLRRSLGDDSVFASVFAGVGIWPASVRAPMRSCRAGCRAGLRRRRPPGGSACSAPPRSACARSFSRRSGSVAGTAGRAGVWSCNRPVRHASVACLRGFLSRSSP